MSTTTPSLYDLPLTAIDGTQRSLAEYRGRVLLVVNVASRCGFTGQYAGLESLYRAYRDRGLVVLGFPCNQFLGQEPGGEQDIAQFCTRDFGVTFPMFAKVEVNGPNAHPLYRHLKAAKAGLLGSRGVKWNFTKFLIDRNGAVVGRFGPMTSPKALAARIESLLGQEAAGSPS